MRVSGALVLAARELARSAATGERDPLSRPSLRGALARAHAWDPAPIAVLVEAAAPSLVATLGSALDRGSATHVGAGAAERDGRVFVVVLSSERRATLAPFARDVAPGSRATLSGRLARGLSRARVVVTLPSGRVVEVRTGGARPFGAEVEFPTAGRYAVEVVADGAGGPEIAALLTVAAGGAPLDAAVARGEARREPADDAGAEAAVLRALDVTRRGQGLPSLSPSAELAAVARRHSAAMAAAGKVAHVIPGSAEIGARLRAAAVPYHRAYENVASAPSALDAHAATEESPAHRGNLLQPGATRVGVGVARTLLASGRPAVYLTEIFVEPVDDGADSPLTPDARVREALWRERDRRGLPPLTADAGLDALAREAAAEMRVRDEPAAPDLADRALALRRELAAADVFVASAPAEAVRSANAGDRRFRRVGVGVVGGDSRRFGAGRFWIAVVYTD